MNKPKRSALLFGITCALALPTAAMAQEELINASEIIGAGVSNGLNAIGTVRNVLLDESGTSVEYLFFETSELVNPTQSGMSFVEISNVDFAPDVGGDWDVIITDTDAQRQPEELQVTRTEAEHRLLSNLLEESIAFSGENARRIDDIMINTETGEIAYFTVEMDSDSFFDADMRSIPASDLQIDASGKVSTEVSLADLDSDDKYRMEATESALR